MVCKSFDFMSSMFFFICFAGFAYLVASRGPCTSQDQEFPQFKVEQCKVEHMVSVFEEKQMLLLSGVQLKDAESVANSLKKFAAPVELWKSTRMETAAESQEAVKQFLQTVDANDAVWY